jgi:prevent-host-death family protein
MKVTVREARKDFSQLLSRVEAGEEVVITRNGKEVARLVSVAMPKVLPDLDDFRAAIPIQGEAMSQTVIRMRQDERY